MTTPANLLTSSTELTVRLTLADQEFDETIEQAMSLLDLIILDLDDYESLLVVSGHYALDGKDLTSCELFEDLQCAYNDNTLEVFLAYAHNQHYNGVGHRDCMSAYVGEFDSDADMMESQLAEEVAEISKISEHIARHVDYQSYWDAIGTHEYFELCGYYFRQQ